MLTFIEYYINMNLCYSKYVWKVSTSKAIFQESLSALCIILSESARGCVAQAVKLQPPWPSRGPPAPHWKLADFKWKNDETLKIIIVWLMWKGLLLLNDKCSSYLLISKSSHICHQPLSRHNLQWLVVSPWRQSVYQPELRSRPDTQHMR